MPSMNVFDSSNAIKELKEMTVNGYAKINLHLEITGMLDDRFHSVETIMQSISLCDRVTVGVLPCDKTAIKIICSDQRVPSDSSNIAYKGAEAFLRAAGLTADVTIGIEKNIPMAAGMAGGSADCAAVLEALNILFDTPFNINELCEIGGRLGSDIPFCLKRGAAFADGKGDKLQPLNSMPDCFIVAAIGGEGVSTPEAYRALDRLYDDFAHYSCVSCENMKKALEKGDLRAIADSLYNIFEDPILSVRPVAKRIKDIMLGHGAMGALMSGSGPSVFSLFEVKGDAERCARFLTEQGYWAGVFCPQKTERTAARD